MELSCVWRDILFIVVLINGFKKCITMNLSFTEKPSSSERMSKFIQERLSHVEKNFGDLCATFSSYARKTAKIRDKGDELSKQISSYVETEVLNPSSKEQLTLFAETLSTIQDYRQAQVQRLDANVIKHFASYGLKCKNKKNELRASFGAQQLEERKKQDLNKLMHKNPSSQFQISEAKSELAKASADASVASKTLEKEMDVFELQKLTDMKKLLMNFVNIEMTFHCKALELYTQCYQNLSEINVDKDLEGFRKHIHPPMSSSRLEIARKMSAGNITPVKSVISPSNRQPSVMTYTEDDDDEEEDDDDDEYDEGSSSNDSEDLSRPSAPKESYQKK